VREELSYTREKALAFDLIYREPYKAAIETRETPGRRRYRGGRDGSKWMRAMEFGKITHGRPAQKNRPWRPGDAVAISPECSKLDGTDLEYVEIEWPRGSGDLNAVTKRSFRTNSRGTETNEKCRSRDNNHISDNEVANA
jgi:hypothetical protein